MMRAAIIVNPATTDVPALREQVDKTLTAAGWSTTLWLETTPTDPGPGMADAAVAAGVQLVVICGGDGTVMACLGALAGTDLPVALLPIGTGNLLARNLGVPIQLEDALAVAVDGFDRHIYLGRIADQPFAVMAGIGLDAAMMADTSEDLKGIIGWPAYVAGGLRNLRDPVMRVQLSIDGGPPLRRSARTVLIGNVGRLQGGLKLLPDAAPDDGLLDVVIVAPRTLPEDVADGSEAQLPEPAGDRRADTVERLDRGVETIGSGRRPRPRPALGRVQPGEAGRERSPDTSSHHAR